MAFIVNYSDGKLKNNSLLLFGRKSFMFTWALAEQKSRHNMSSCHISHHATAHPVTPQCLYSPLSLAPYLLLAPTCTPPVHSLAACVNVFLQRDSCVNQMSMSLHKKHIVPRVCVWVYEETTGKLMLASKPTSPKVAQKEWEGSGGGVRSHFAI